MAEAIFDSLTKNHIASSAGLNPPKNWEGERLSKTRYVALCMAESGLDVTDKISKRLTGSMVLEANKIIVIGEKEGWPNFLKDSNNVSYWNIIDPDTGEMELHRTVRDQIKSMIKTLIEEINKQHD